MKTRRSKAQTLSGLFLVTALVFNCFIFSPAPAHAQKRAVVITADQPNIWTLEQAHYLLAQMHRRNLDLRAKGLEDLDPNEIQGLRFDVIKSLIEVRGQLQPGRPRNQPAPLLQSDLQRASAASPCFGRRDRLREESLDLTREITQLQGEIARATDRGGQAAARRRNRARTALRDRVDKEANSDRWPN